MLQGQTEVGASLEEDPGEQSGGCGGEGLGKEERKGEAVQN